MSPINDLVLFLTQHKTTPDVGATHTGMYIPFKGSWHISVQSDLDKFWSIYTDLYGSTVLQDKRLGVGITEVQADVSPLVVDIDFKYDMTKGYDRLYHMQTDIMSVVNMYNEAIRMYVKEPNLIVHIFEKPKPRMCDNQMKDGIHMMFKEVVIPKEVRKRIHQHVKGMLRLKQGKMSDAFQQIYSESCIDECAATNNWLIYGCCKRDDSDPYKLTWIVDKEQQCTVVDTDVTDPRIFSIHNHPPSELLESAHTIMMANAHVMDNHNNNNNGEDHVKPTIDEFENIRKLLTLLSPNRYEDEPTWIRVGWCLHNICEQKEYLNMWIEWSKQSSKFKSGECEKQWRRFRTDGYKLPSLRNWARNDNPVAFEQYIKETAHVFLEYSINCGAHYDIATVLHCKYSDVYRCVNPKSSNDWYYYDNHRWNEMPGGYILMNKMSVDLSADFIKMANYHKKCMVHHDPNVVKEHQAKRDKCLKLEYGVKDNGFKSGVLKECSRMFYDPEFKNRLDSKPNLVCFKNGVYEIETNVFRDGQPDDYISKSTNIDYMHHEQNDPIVAEINAFLEKVQPNNIMRNYVMMVLATFLGGSTEEQTFQIWTGSGSNGKSTIIELFEKAFGDDYCGKFPVTLLTKDRANSNACTPELQDVMRKRFASMQEPNDNDVIHTGAMKEYTGGDKIYSRGLFANPTPFKPQFKLVLLCNKMPQIKGWDYGTWRRIRVVNFTSSFVDQPNPNNPNEYAKDKRLPEKFEKWREAFMWMLIEYLKAYKKGGLKEPIQVIQASKDYKKRSDSFMQFIDDNFECTGNEHDKMLTTEVVDAFKMWWRNTNTTPVPSTLDLMDYIFGNTKVKKHNKTHLACIKIKHTMDMS